MQRNRTIFAAMLVTPLLLAGCGSVPERDYQALLQSGLPDCPDSPNCVKTGAESDSQRVDDFQLEGDWLQQKQAIIAAATSMDRTELAEEKPYYLRFEATSLLMRFVDDLEVLYRPEHGLEVRSASRVGHSDFGVNRERVETLRAKLN
jgi:uncharacterized protein (DUF1499 family)